MLNENPEEKKQKEAIGNESIFGQSQLKQVMKNPSYDFKANHFDIRIHLLL